MARRLVSLGPRYVLVKGGHGDGDRSEDVLTDGKQVWRLESPRLEGPTHGAGCVLSAALTAWLARGEDVVEAVRRAKSLTWLSIVRRLHLGAGSPIANPSRTLGPDK
jgi:hydroxymethylpyrimidine/phosphomethylpyrimidine kinase